VRVYNTKVESVPSNIVANMFKFEKATYFQVDEPAVRQAPDVSFGEIAYRGDPEQQQRQLPPQQSAPQQSTPPVQFDRQSEDQLPNPQEYQQPPQSYQPPQQGQSQAPQQGQYQPPEQGGYQTPQQTGGYEPPQPGGYVPPETGQQNPNQR
jgi:LemA protein